MNRPFRGQPGNLQKNKTLACEESRPLARAERKGAQLWTLSGQSTAAAAAKESRNLVVTQLRRVAEKPGYEVCYVVDIEVVVDVDVVVK